MRREWFFILPPAWILAGYWEWTGHNFHLWTWGRSWDLDGCNPSSSTSQANSWCKLSRTGISSVYSRMQRYHVHRPTKDDQGVSMRSSTFLSGWKLTGDINKDIDKCSRHAFELHECQHGREQLDSNLPELKSRWSIVKSVCLDQYSNVPVSFDIEKTRWDWPVLNVNTIYEKRWGKYMQDDRISAY